MDGEDIGQVAIVGLRPEMRVSPRVEQLRVNSNFVGSPLYAAFDDMCYAELLADFAQIARRAALVLHDARAADHFEISNLCQVRQDFVLHTVGEVSIGFVFTSVFKREHRNAFVEHTQR